MDNRKKFINYNLPYIARDEIREVVDTLKSGWLTTGPKTKIFEDEFRRYVGARHAVALSSCTAGIHLSLLAAGIGKGDEVITTPYTFASTILAIIEVGAKPVFVDIRKDTFNLNESQIEEKINNKTKAILPVHFGGAPCEMEIILKVAKKYGLYVIEDAAHATGSEYNGVKVGNLGDITAFSFYATKNLTTGEGGMITTNNANFAEKIRILSLHGINRDAFNRYAKGGNWYYEILEKGYKYNMMDIQAAMGIHQLRRLEKMNKRRKMLADLYCKYLNNIDEVITNLSLPNIKHAWHLYVIQLDLNKLKIDRNMFIEKLKRRNIGASVHFIPIFCHPYFQKYLGVKAANFPIADKIYNRVISLPLYPSLKDAEVKYVAGAVREIVSKYRK